MGALAAGYNADPAYNPDPDNLVNASSTAAFVIPGDTQCPGAKLYLPPHPDGREYLKQSVLAGDGCIDIARTSGIPRPLGIPPGFDLPSFEYYAYALDAFGWSTASPLAPPDLTLNHVRDVFNCTFTDWSQVGGLPGPIERYWPTGGSTAAIFQTEVLRFDPTAIVSPPCPAVQPTPDNGGTIIAGNGDAPTAIVPYSGSRWVAQSLGTVPDMRIGQTIHDMDGKNIVRFNGSAFELAVPNAADPAAVVREDNVRLISPAPYPGVRYVFNVVDNTQISYPGAIRYVGFDNVAKGSTSPRCSGKKATTLLAYGWPRSTAPLVRSLPTTSPTPPAGAGPDP
jgi:hypothetical protein